MQVEVDVKCIHTKFGGHSISVLETLVLFNFSFRAMDYNSPWGQKYQL